MSIKFECSCGRKMSAKEEFAGRRLRCPECQRVVMIPKPGSAVIPMSTPRPGTPSSRLMVQPPLQKTDLGDMDVTRPTNQDTLPPPSKAPDFDSPEQLAALFATPTSNTPVLSSLKATPIAAPVAPPVAPPVARPVAPTIAPPVTPTVAPPVATAPEDELDVTQFVGTVTEPPAQTDHSWIDQSLRQIATPWRPGDEQRFQSSVPPARESESPVIWIVPIVALAAAILFAV
jgi:hypothetical protein